jgi:hypothetical protein
VLQRSTKSLKERSTNDALEFPFNAIASLT